MSITIKKRLRAGLLIFLSLFFLLVVRLFYIQIIQGEELQEKALSIWTKSSSVTAQRGRILDTNGVVMAQSGTAYKVLIWPKSIAAGDRTRIAGELAAVLGMDEAVVLEKISDTSKWEIVLKRQIESDVADEITALKLGRGVVIAIDTKRYYPAGSLMSQTIGFTTVDGVGQDGIELRMNEYLAGRDGRVVSEVDKDGNTLAYGVQEYIDAVQGCDTVLTTDSVIQAILEDALSEALEVNDATRAIGVVMRASTGEIVALSSQPDYDLNSPPRSDLALLAELSRNRVVADAYEPGSTFKVITLAAALDSGAVSMDTTFDCPGYYVVNGQRIKCWRSGGHQHQSLTKAAENSCNVAFMQMALSMGVEEFYDYIYSFGFGSVTGSGLSGESSGIVTHEKYVRDTDLARIGFGQSIAVTPLQLITAVCAAVNGGELMQPYIVDRVVSADGEILVQNTPTVVRRVISGETSARVRTILESVVENGSGRNAQVVGYRVGGKTGTAQKYGEDGNVADGLLIASFIGFAPADDPEYVCLILVDEPQVGPVFGSTVAAPYVGQVLEEILHYAGYLPTEDTETVTVPDVVGLAVGRADDELEDAGLDGIYQGTGDVIAQVPAAGTVAAKGMPVLLYTADTAIERSGDGGADTVNVPVLTGKTRLAANDMLVELGLVLAIDPEYNYGNAFSQSVQAGTSVSAGTVITVKFRPNEDD